MNLAEQNRLIIEHMALVQPVAAAFRDGSVEFEDLLGMGREGLVKAARSFDSSKSKFSTWATTCIHTAIYTGVRAATQPSQFYPKDEVVPTLESDKKERIYEYQFWGDRGNAAAICETWAKLDSPADLSDLFDDIAHKREKFAAAFISLTGSQRKLVEMVFLRDMTITVPQAASELGISRFQAGRMLKKALKIMREVITRMETKTIKPKKLAKYAELAA